jgi:hypothetical protein
VGQDYSIVRDLANSVFKHGSKVEFREAILAQTATLLAACQINNMLVNVRVSVKITILEIITEATTSPIL